MSPTSAKLDGFIIKNEQPKKVINGPRPSPLLINKDSHLIRKQKREPIIIYTQSPKIIHAKAQDFMALVQGLTGMSKSNNDRSAVSTVSSESPTSTRDMTMKGYIRGMTTEDFESSFSDGGTSNNNSTISMKQEEEKLQGMNLLGGANCDCDETSSALTRDDDDDETCVNETLDFADMPLFTPTPNSSDFFRSSRSPVYKYSSGSPFGILGSLISPSGLEFLRELPEY